MRRKNISLSPENDGDFKNENKIELLSCQHGSQKCKEHLKFINQNYSKAYQYRFEKDYANSIEMLKGAYYKAVELKDSQCSQCSSVFRFTIIQSLENINKELKDMTTGIFRKKRYLFSYKESCTVLDEFKENNQ